MAGKHVKDSEPRSRRSVLTGLATLGLIAATTVATGEIPKQDISQTEPLPRPDTFDELLSAKQGASTQRLALRVDKPVKPAPRRVKRPVSRARPKPMRPRLSERQRVLEVSKRYFGVPYRWGGKSPRSGLDCSGYTRLVYKQVGVDLPHGSRAQAKRGVPTKSPQAGDLLFVRSAFGRVHHVAIYAGNGYIHDAPHSGSVVGRRKVWSKPSRTFYRRVL